ncbi:MAG TPA: Uma2 family endonuclease [Pyrinomonadaceae bacterium]|jgi:Uma2 family endonuclease
MSLQIAKHHFTATEFERMGEAGILAEDARLELIEGEIIELSPISSHHAACVMFLNRFLNRAVGDETIVSVHNPIKLDDFSEPQPDVALLRLRDDFYRDGHPTPADVLLVVEVADTTVEYDRRVKAPLYAKAGIAEYWLVNLPDEQLEIYSDPENGEYARAEHVRRPDAAQSRSLPKLSVSVSDVLG